MLRSLLLLLPLCLLPIPSLADTQPNAQLTTQPDAQRNPDTPRQTTDIIQLKIHRHLTWSEIAPKGVDADGLRMNLAPGDALQFQDLTLSVTQMTASRAEDHPDTVTITLKQRETTETRTLNEGVAFNWNGYHVSIVAIYGKKGELGFGSTVVEVATINSLPDHVAHSDKANGPAFRLRVKHRIDKLTLHHSSTTHTAEEKLDEKLRNMQLWGERDRNWFDVPYHFFVDLDGTIYEARDYRYMGDTNTRYDPRGHFLINCYGNYNKVEPNQQQLDSIAALMAWAAAEFRIESLKIYGHRDLAQTSCPGDHLYKYVEDGTFQKMVEAMLAKGKPEVVWVEGRR